MRRKYGDCQRIDGDCTKCDLVSYGRDCHNRPITKMEWCRMAAGLSQKELAQKSGIHPAQLQKIEAGTREAGKMEASTLLSIADVLGVHPRDLI